MQTYPAPMGIGVRCEVSTIGGDLWAYTRCPGVEAQFRRIKMTRQTFCSIATFNDAVCITYAEARNTLAELTFPDNETASDDYATRFSGEIGGYFLERQSKVVRELLADLPPGTALDIGGGHCQLTADILQLGHHLTIHGSTDACHLRKSRRFLAEAPDRIALSVSPLTALPFADRQFDIVLAFRLLAHLENWQEFIQEAARVTKSALIFDYASLASFNILTPLLFRIKKRLEGNTRTYFCHTFGELEPELRRNGFSRIAVRKQFTAPMGIYRSLKDRALAERAETFFERIGLTAAVGSPAVVIARRD